MFSSWTRWSILPFQSLQYDGGNTWCEYGTLLSFRLFTDFASVEIVYSFCILWQCKKSNFQKGQFSISPLRRRLCTRNNIPRIYGPQIALCTFFIPQRTPDTCHNHHTRWLCKKKLGECKFLQLEASFVANFRNFKCKILGLKLWMCKKMTNIRYVQRTLLLDPA